MHKFCRLFTSWLSLYCNYSFDEHTKDVDYNVEYDYFQTIYRAWFILFYTIIEQWNFMSIYIYDIISIVFLS